MYKIFVFVFVVCFSLNLDAQQIYTWEDYGLSFSLADDFIINLDKFCFNLGLLLGVVMGV